MRRLVLIFITGFLVTSAAAQSRPVTKEYYDQAFRKVEGFLGSMEPFRITTTEEEFDRGNSISKTTSVYEAVLWRNSRTTKTTIRNGVTSVTYEIYVDRHVYCSEDGENWDGPQQYSCDLSRRIQGPREVESTDYFEEDGWSVGKDVQIYRKYTIYEPNDLNPRRQFEETITTVGKDLRVVSVITNEGMFDPKETTFVRKALYDFKSRIKPIVAPK